MERPIRNPNELEENVKVLRRYVQSGRPYMSVAERVVLLELLDFLEAYELMGFLRESSPDP